MRTIVGVPDDVPTCDGPVDERGACSLCGSSGTPGDWCGRPLSEPVRIELDATQMAWLLERCESPREPSARLIEAVRRSRRRQEGE
jgi:hypothetical protein